MEIWKRNKKKAEEKIICRGTKSNNCHFKVSKQKEIFNWTQGLEKGVELHAGPNP